MSVFKEKRSFLLWLSFLAIITCTALNEFSVDQKSLLKFSKSISTPTNKFYSNVLPAESYYGLSCEAIINSSLSDAELEKLQQRIQNTKQEDREEFFATLSESNLTSWIENERCDSFIKKRKYITAPLSDREAEFPIAYAIVAYEKAGEVERLLRSIYRPQNVYCIHADKKSDNTFYQALVRLASCFPNVILASKRETVTYAHYSRLQADFNCMEDLLNHPIKWKYYINLCGTDFPLKTNAEIVRYLSYISPHNEIECVPMSPGKVARLTWHYQLEKGENGKYNVVNTREENPPPPHGIGKYAGSAYNILSRAFVDYTMNNSTVFEIRQWSRDTLTPDEFLWAALSRFPGAPGYLPPNPRYDKNEFQSLARIVKWYDHVLNGLYPRCYGAYRHGICVYGAGDLPWLLEQKHLFANKFSAWNDDLAIQCLEKHLRRKELSEKF
ncbi:Oidioi.mRNA.OKI2018_I69.XSR.g13707.t1.cds [Oikopleura dioica]|uniref:Oidioi.mRNA.OKI2018_I69.XSR.g13707.t1.cds n=1 Tax=Oikopleura dioica TaxID=34765 RepID=A0ABN7SBF0_OIKDI|nr:Oidioi.mRNA.OKI2018_I69.XSR.g13707.t1.cds [Oikopleura dioica]